MNTRQPARDNVVEAVLAACRADPVLASPREHRVVIAFSGGPDSSTLLHALVRARRRLRLDLLAVHVDHGLRPGAAEEALAAGAFAAELGIPLEVARVKPRGGSEDAARRARHAGLEAVAARVGAGTVALGHTFDDQAETVLLHLLRGSGLEGLAAMAVREDLRFRPLLAVRRSQVDAYCARHRLAPLRDPSNEDPVFLRNRVRHELLPLLERRFNPRASEALVRLALAAGEEHAVVVAAAAGWLESNSAPYPRPAFLALPPAVRVEVLRRAWAAAAGLERPPGDAAKLRQAMRMLERGGRGMIQLGRGFELVVDANAFAIRPHNPLTEG